MTAFKSYNPHETFTKVPEVTLVFWIIKIAATTLGETGGDSVTMTLNWGYLIGTAIFLGVLVVLVAAQIFAKRFHPFLYWSTIVASTTFGTTMADFADRSLGIGYTGGSSLLLALLLATLALCGTALGDWMADTTGLGYQGGALVFAAGLAVLAAVYFWTNISRVTLFWAAFILTRPLGATVGDFLDKPVDHGGLGLSRPIASTVIAVFILGCILLLPQRAGRHPSQSQPSTIS
jgi:uncharacterized membrane-anchored protein